MERREFRRSRNLYGRELTAAVTLLEGGSNVLLFGGDREHIGAISIADEEDGIYYTHSRKKYALSLAFFAVISELPFDLAFFNDLASRRGTFPFFWEYQNVFFTLLIGLCTIWCIEKLSSLTKKYKKAWILFLQILCVVGMSFLAHLIKADYGIRGILIIVIFYVGRKNRIGQVLGFLLGYMILENSLHISQIIVCIIVLLYNKKRGGLKLNKYVFYAFYPAHTLLLYTTTLILTHWFC